GAHHAAEGSAIDREPCGGHRHDRHDKYKEAGPRVEEIADEGMSAQLRGGGERGGGGAGHKRASPGGTHGETPRGGARQETGRGGGEKGGGEEEGAKKGRPDAPPEAPPDPRRDAPGAEKAAAARHYDREVGADGIEAAMREIDDASEREDQRKAERNEQVIGP